MTILVWHPGSPYATGDVARGLVAGLKANGVRVVQYQHAGRFREARRYLEGVVRRRRREGWQLERPTFRAIARWASSGILEAAARWDPAWVLVVNGGYQDPTFYVYLRRFGFRVALIGTEAPYQVAAELHLARHVDYLFTNERSTLPVYRAVTPAVSYLPAAFDPAVHRPDVEIPAGVDVPAHDVVFVGSGFEERIAWLEAIDWTGIDLGLYGDWRMLRRRSPLRAYVRSQKPIPNAYAALLYQRAKVGINLHRTSANLEPGCAHIRRAESANPRAYELAASGCAVVTDYRPEVLELYGPSAEARGYVSRTPAGMAQGIRALLASPAARATWSAELAAAMAGQSWVDRARHVLEVLGDGEGASDARCDVGAAPAAHTAS